MIVIVMSFLVAGKVIFSMDLSAFGWCIYGGVIFLAEILFCGLIWFAVDAGTFKQCKQLLMLKIKSL